MQIAEAQFKKNTGEGISEVIINDQNTINRVTGVDTFEGFQIQSDLESINQQYAQKEKKQQSENIKADVVIQNGVEKSTPINTDTLNAVMAAIVADDKKKNNQSSGSNDGGDDNPVKPKIDIKTEEKIDDKANALQEFENKKIAEQGSMIVDKEKGQNEPAKATDDKPKDLAEEAKKNIEKGENEFSSSIIASLISGKNFTKDQMIGMRKPGIMRKIFQKLREQRRGDLLYNFLVSLFITSKLRKNPNHSKKDSLNLLNSVLTINKKTPISQSFAGSFRLATLGNKLTIDNIKRSVRRNAGERYKQLYNRLISDKIFTEDQLKEIKTKSVPTLLFMTAGLTEKGREIANAMNSAEMNFQDAGDKHPNFMQSLIRSCDTQSQDFQKIKAGLERDGKIGVGNGEIANKLIKRYEEESLGLNSKEIKNIMNRCLFLGERVVVEGETQQDDKTIGFVGLQYVVDKTKGDNASLYEIDGQEYTADQVELLAVRMAEEGKIPESVALAHIKAGGRNPYEILAEIKAIKDHVYHAMLGVKPIEKSNKTEFGKDSLLQEDQDIQQSAVNDEIDDIESQDQELKHQVPVNVLSMETQAEDRGGIEDFDNIVSKLLDDTFGDFAAKPADKSGLQDRERDALGIEENIESTYSNNTYNTEYEIEGKSEELSIEDLDDIDKIIEEDIIEEIVEEEIEPVESFVNKLEKQRGSSEVGIG